MKFDEGLIGKGFKPLDFERLQIHGGKLKLESRVREEKKRDTWRPEGWATGGAVLPKSETLEGKRLLFLLFGLTSDKKMMMCRALALLTLRTLLLMLLWCALALPAAAQIGGLDASFAPKLNGGINAMVKQSDGKLLIAGDFTTVNGAPSNRIARLNTDGTLDTSFSIGGGANATVRCLTLEVGSSRILIGGDFTSYNGTTRNRVARLASNGTLDTAFAPEGGANSTVYGIASSSYGTLIGGAFTKVNGIDRKYIAQLYGNGAIDVGFDPAANDVVYAVATDTSYYPQGYYIGGAFTSLGGFSRNRIARIASSGDVDTGFYVGTGANANVYAISVPPLSFSSTACIYVGGDFTTFNGVSKGHLAAVSTANDSGTVPDPSFKIRADSTVRCLYQEPSPPNSNSALFVGGDFSTIDGIPKNRVARLLAPPDNTYPYTSLYYLDTTFDVGSGPDGSINAISTEIDGKFFIGGQFTSVSGTSNTGMARLYGDTGNAIPSVPENFRAGGVSSSQNALLWSSVSYITNYKVERSADGLGGWTQVAAPLSSLPYFDSGLAHGSAGYYRVRAVSTNGESASTPIIKATTFTAPWNEAGALDSSFNPGKGFNYVVSNVALQSDGKSIIAGSFESFNGFQRKYLARLNTDGSLDTSFGAASGPGSRINDLAVQPDGRILIGGYFTDVNNTSKNNIARLNSDGSLDSSFVSGVGPSSTVDKIAITPDGKAIITGAFLSYNGVARSYIARIKADGTLDTAFNASINSPFPTLCIQRDGRILLGGSFTMVNGQDRSNLVRLNSDGTTDRSFNAGSDVYGVTKIVQQPDGKIAIIGSFNTVNGLTRKYVARLNSDGSIDPSFDPGIGPDNTLDALAVQPDGKMVIGGGTMTSFGNSPRLGIARLNLNGSLDTTFQPGIGSPSGVQVVVVQKDLRLLIGGYFTSFNGVSQGFITRLLGDNSNVSAPASPEGLSIDVISSTQLLLKWTDPLGKTGFRIERSTDGVTNWLQIADTGAPYGFAFYDDKPLTPGAKWHYRVRAYNSAGTSAPSSVVSAVTLTSYQQWKINFGFALNTPDTDDSDDDGVGALLEYALALNPNANDSSGLPVAQTIGNYFSLTYTKARSDLTYVVETSSDLRTWTSSGVSQGGGGSIVTASVPINGTRQFLRLRVSRP